MGILRQAGTYSNFLDHTFQTTTVATYLLIHQPTLDSTNYLQYLVVSGFLRLTDLRE